jgi:molecular chaperone GrpE
MTRDYKNFDKRDEDCLCKDDGNHESSICSDVNAGEKMANVDEITELRTQLNTQTDLYLRALADLENFKKRMQKDRMEVRALVAGTIVEELLPVLDHFELGLQSAEEHGTSEILTGFRMVFEQLKNILITRGLGELLPLNQEFNPHEHDCVRREYSETLPENIVTSVVRKGYKLHDRLIRPATVVVSTRQRPEVE